VEGDLDEALLRRILSYVGVTLGAVHGRQGKHFLLKSINGYNNAARYAPWIVLVDLDRDCDCAPPCARRWLANPSIRMCFRVAVRAVEAWLLADRERVAQLLGMRTALLPAHPDSLDDPKRELVNLARRTRRRAIRDDLVPRDGSGRLVGPLYTTRMIEFVEDAASGWRPDEAIRNSESLSRSVQRLHDLCRTSGCTPVQPGPRLA
jgi:hypothetical protein